MRSKNNFFIKKSVELNMAYHLIGILIEYLEKLEIWESYPSRRV